MAPEFSLRWYLPALVAIVMLVFAGCSGGGGGGDSGPKEQLARMVLGPDDLPEGYLEDEDSYTSNQDLALGDDGLLAELEGLGRLLGHTVVYSRGDVSEVENPMFGLESGASLYKTSAGAGESFSQAAEDARAEDWESRLGFGETEIKEIDHSLGEESLWLRITGVMEIGEDKTPVLVIDDQILFRQGGARGYLRISAALSGSSDREALVDEAAAFAEAQLSRMKGVLD